MHGQVVSCHFTQKQQQQQQQQQQRKTRKETYLKCSSIT